MANFNKTICKRHRVTIASRRAHRVITTDDDNSDTITTTVAGIEPGASTGSGSHRHRINRHGADRRRDHRERTAVASRSSPRHGRVVRWRSMAVACQPRSERWLTKARNTLRTWGEHHVADVNAGEPDLHRAGHRRGRAAGVTLTTGGSLVKGCGFPDDAKARAAASCL
jgi:hypothetical protein